MLGLPGQWQCVSHLTRCQQSSSLEVAPFRSFVSIFSVYQSFSLSKPLFMPPAMTEWNVWINWSRIICVFPKSSNAHLGQSSSSTMDWKTLWLHGGGNLEDFLLGEKGTAGFKGDSGAASFTPGASSNPVASSALLVATSCFRSIWSGMSFAGLWDQCVCRKCDMKSISLSQPGSS